MLNFIRKNKDSFFLFLAIVLFQKTIFGFCLIPSGSMEPTLAVGDVVFVNRTTYGLTFPGMSKPFASWSAPAAGDVIIFDAPKAADKKESLFIKRVVAQAGDTVEVRNYQLVVNGVTPAYALNGTAVTETIGGKKHLIQLGDGPAQLQNMPPFTVPAGHVFVMGDHRNNSADSRVWGALPVERIRGKAIFIMPFISSPLSHWGSAL